MNQADVLKIFKDKSGFLSGHFQLSSGLHSEGYMQCAKVLQEPRVAEQLGCALAKKLSQHRVDVVVGPAMGGLIIGHEVAHALDVPFIFTERVDGVMTLRRGFAVQAGQKAVVVEDVVTTGGSAKEVVQLLEQAGVTVLSLASIIDRSEGSYQGPIPLVSLCPVSIKTYQQQDCPMCKKGIVIDKPGSRLLINKNIV